MKLKGWIVAVALVVLAPPMTRAATEANFGARTTGDLVELCAATPDNAIGTAAVNFLRGVCGGRGRGGTSEPGWVPRIEAVLHAEPSALSQRSAECVHQLGTDVA